MVSALSPAVMKDFRDDLLVDAAPSMLENDRDFAVVRVTGAGTERPNARQAVRTYMLVKNAITTDYVQIATASSTQRVFFIGLSFNAQSTGYVYVEDADSGNIAISDGSTVPLAFVNPGTGFFQYWPPKIRECKRGIRIALTNSAASQQVVTVYYLIELVNGQQASL